MDDPELAELAEDVLYASRALVGVAARSMAAAGDDITLVQYRLLVVLGGRGLLSLGEAAAELGLQPPAASRLCDRLVRKGLVSRRRSPHSGREIELGLTEAGADVVRRVTQARVAALEKILAKLPAAERYAVRDALAALADAADETRELAAMGWLV